MGIVRVRLVVLAVVIVAVAVGSGLAIAAAMDGPDGAESAATAPEPTNYCDAARAALQYPGTDDAQVAVLLDRVVELAPADGAPTVRNVRAQRPGSERYEAEHNVWDWYNTSHCCGCHFAEPPPEILKFTPEQRARVEAGGLP